jgi:hypothetical protein
MKKYFEKGASALRVIDGYMILREMGREGKNIRGMDRREENVGVAIGTRKMVMYI